SVNVPSSAAALVPRRRAPPSYPPPPYAAGPVTPAHNRIQRTPSRAPRSVLRKRIEGGGRGAPRAVQRPQGQGLQP
uniref:Uncharacterized protein n=1 Tax=Aegilops tauschii subsp. strangulata TaxID=200361 RepID=A0A453R5D8_AEGTS